MKIGLQFAMPAEFHALPGARDLSPVETISGVPFFEAAPGILACARWCQQGQRRHGRGDLLPEIRRGPDPQRRCGRLRHGPATEVWWWRQNSYSTTWTPPR